jgi:hypothetical protein
MRIKLFEEDLEAYNKINIDAKGFEILFLHDYRRLSMNNINEFFEFDESLKNYKLTGLTKGDFFIALLFEEKGDEK